MEKQVGSRRQLLVALFVVVAAVIALEPSDNNSNDNKGNVNFLISCASSGEWQKVSSNDGRKVLCR